MFNFLKTILAVFVLAFIIFAATNYSGTLKKQVGVKGASTDRTKEISQGISHDLGDQTNTVKKQILDLKISDMITGLSRVQKIPQDFKNAQNYIKEHIDNMVKSKH